MEIHRPQIVCQSTKDQRPKTKDQRPKTNDRPGGWEQPENGLRSSELRGHFAGHYLSASALLFASTGDSTEKSKGDYMVAEMAKCQAQLGGKYLSAFSTTWWDRLEKGERVWAPFYTIHKIMAGIFDTYRFAGNKQALEVLEGMAAWADEWTAAKTDEHMRILTIEFGGIAETLYHLAAATHEPRWGTVGDRFQKRSFVTPLALRRESSEGCTPIPTSRRRLPPRVAMNSPATCASTTSPTTSSTKSSAPART